MPGIRVRLSTPNFEYLAEEPSQVGVLYYGPGQHPENFIGFRVTVAWDSEYKQDYFSTRQAKVQDESDVWYRYQHLRARYWDAKWQTDGLWFQYQKSVNSNYPTVKPGRGLGVYGLTMSFYRRSEEKWEPCFVVSRPNLPAVRFMFTREPFSTVWKEAVDRWAREYSILSEDHDRILACRPEPERFKDLRRQMNENEGCSIPVEALSPVFREQREAIAKQRLEKQYQTVDLHRMPHAKINRDAAGDEILAWFDRETQRAS